MKRGARGAIIAVRAIEVPGRLREVAADGVGDTQEGGRIGGQVRMDY